jgi:hypothetical protein
LKREEAVELVKKYLKERVWFYHALAVEAIMRSLARYFGEDEELWGITGLLHDIDYSITKGEMKRHGIVAEGLLKELVREEVLRAVKAHNFEGTGVKPETRMEKALIASDAISGLLVACALVMPSKKLCEVKVKTVAKKFKAKDFARKVSRERIRMCEEIGIPKEKFFEIALEGLRSISSKIGL